VDTLLVSGTIAAVGAILVAVINRSPKGLDILEASRDALQEDVTRLENRVDRLEDDRRDLRTKVEACHAERADDQARFARTVSSLQRQIDTLRGSV
jgi:outer membrane murein-binding lipoprotein Lpp